MTNISTIHPNGTRFTYLPEFGILNWFGQIVARRVRKEPGVLIEYPDGVKRWISNSWYE